MNEANQFVLVVIREDALMGHWSFRVADELAVARHLLHDSWEYENVFWALRISWREIEQLSPEQLLQAIRDSYPNRHVRAVLYLLRVESPADCVPGELPASVSGNAHAE